MNSLSWLIYLMTVISNISIALKFVLVFMTIILGISIIFSPIIFYKVDWKDVAYVLKRFIIGLSVVLVLAITVPNKRTLILISASEIGEKVYKSDQVKGIVDPSMELLREWIKNEVIVIKNKSQ